jgi:hypothetical protein
MPLWRGDRAGNKAVRSVGVPELAIDGSEKRILALLAAAYGTAIDPAVLAHIRRASSELSRGNTNLARVHLAYSRLPRLPDDERRRFAFSLPSGRSTRASRRAIYWKHAASIRNRWIC